MARSKKGAGFNGSLNGKTYYSLKDVGEVVRKTYGPPKEVMESNPNYEVTLNNAIELGGGSKASKAIRQGLGDRVVEFQDSYMSSRLTSVLKACIRNGKSSNTPRKLHLKDHPKQIIGFQLNKHKSFSNIFSAPYSCTINEQQTVIDIHMSNHQNYYHGKVPKGATHCVLTGALSLVSSYQWEPSLKEYVAINPQQNAIGTAIQSDPINVNQVGGNINLQLQMPNDQPLAKDTTATVWLGITYYQQDHHLFVPLVSQKAMECIAVY